MRRILDPELFKSDPVDRDAQQRLVRLADLVRRVEGDASLARDEATLAAFESLLEEGPIQRMGRTLHDLDYTDYARDWRYILVLFNRVRIDAQSGRTDSAERLLKIALSFCRSNEEREETIVDWLAGLETLKVVDQALQDVAPRLSDAQLARLATCLDDPDSLPILADPKCTLVYDLPMARGRRAFFITLGVAGLLAITAYSLFRPRWITATEAEVRAMLDPRLVKVDPVDQSALKRYDRLVQAVGKFRSEGVYPSATAKGVRSFLARERANIDAIDSIIAEGPLLRPRRTMFSDSDGWARERQVVRALSLAARHEARTGRPESAERLLSTSLRLLWRLRQMESLFIDMLVDDGSSAMVLAGLLDAAPYLSEAQLARLADYLPIQANPKADFERIVRGELQYLLMDILPDPIAWSRRIAPEVEPGKGLAAFVMEGEENDDGISGNYDARETVREINFILQTALENAGRSRGRQDDRGYLRKEALTKDVPENHSAGQSGWRLRLARLRYRWEMARVPNSFGKTLVGVCPGDSINMDSWFRRRTLHEAHRTLVALWRYRKRFGRQAPTLRSLVDSGFLPEIPVDYLDLAPSGDAPLRYDPKRRLLWSTGQNGRDDGGVGAAGPRSLDLTWTTP